MKFGVLMLIACLLSGCGVGVYSVSSGRADIAQISFVDKTAYKIVVKIDDEIHLTNTIKVKNYKPGMNIKKTAIRAINIPIGRHEIEVQSQGEIIYSQSIFISTNEHKIIEL